MSVIVHMENGDAYLVHYGVPGMKWGVRKAIERSDRRLQKRSRTYKDRKKVYKKLPTAFNTFSRNLAENRYNAEKVKNSFLKGTKLENKKQKQIAKSSSRVEKISSVMMGVGAATRAIGAIGHFTLAGTALAGGIVAAPEIATAAAIHGAAKLGQALILGAVAKRDYNNSKKYKELSR